jgi:FkbM family methyltransferase
MLARMLPLRICNREGHTFLLGGLGPGSTVVDLGMNLGAFARYIAGTTGAYVVGAEPVPALFKALAKMARIGAFNVALGGEDGEAMLSLSPGLGSTILGGARPRAQRVKVPLVSFATFRAMAGIGAIQLLKVDIEGAELDMFEAMADDEFADIEQITVEFHDFLDRAHVPRIRDILARLRSLGFHVINISLRHHADVICLNRRVFPLTALARAQLRFNKLAQGAVRVPRRHLLGLPN